MKVEKAIKVISHAITTDNHVIKILDVPTNICKKKCARIIKERGRIKKCKFSLWHIFPVSMQGKKTLLNFFMQEKINKTDKIILNF